MLNALNTSYHNAPFSSSFSENKRINSASNENEQNTTNQSQAKNEEKKENTQMVNGVELTAKEVAQVMKLQSIDAEVRAHEAAHMAAGGGLAGSATYGYTRGPDNKMYATSGEVPIKMQKGNTPEETIANARQVVAAAMAPANPSPQDYKVAANAARMEIEARVELTRQKAEEAKEKKDENQNTAQDDKKTQENQSKNSHIINAYNQNTPGSILDFAS